jgi:hypothetical protein
VDVTGVTVDGERVVHRRLVTELAEAQTDGAGGGPGCWSAHNGGRRGRGRRSVPCGAHAMGPLMSQAESSGLRVAQADGISLVAFCGGHHLCSLVEDCSLWSLYRTTSLHGLWSLCRTISLHV